MYYTKSVFCNYVTTNASINILSTQDEDVCM